MTYEPMENEVVCPECSSKNAHIITTIITGKESFQFDGKKITSREPFIRPTDRGSQIQIMYYTEQCDHVWIETIYFHKGNVFRENTLLFESELFKFHQEMWRD